MIYSLSAWPVVWGSVSKDHSCLSVGTRQLIWALNSQSIVQTTFAAPLEAGRHSDPCGADGETEAEGNESVGVRIRTCKFLAASPALRSSFSPHCVAPCVVSSA